MRLLRGLWCWKTSREHREEIVREELIQSLVVCQGSLSSPQTATQLSPTMTRESQRPHTDHSSSGDGHRNAGSTESPLMRLPVELIQQIAAFADSPAAAALALSSRSLCTIIGTQVWENVSNNMGNPEDRKEFLLLLERDLLPLCYCPRCKILHRRFLPGVPFTPHPVDKHDRNVNAYLPSPGDQVHYRDVRSVMKQHFWGKEHGQPLTILYRDLEVQKLGCLIRHQTRARIVANELILRMRWKLSSLGPLELINLQVCPHQILHTTPSNNRTLLTYPARNVLGSIVNCKWLHAHPEQPRCSQCWWGREKSKCTHIPKQPKFEGPVFCSMCDGVRRCGHCATDFAVSVLKRSREWEIHIDAWLNFGYGSSLDDPKWKSHKLGSSDWALSGEGEAHADSLPPPGSIKQAYYSLKPMDDIEEPSWWGRPS
ncbi:hypothetical protein AOQ84DRAFT_372508 [Glonium stellatum]|uniref:F-box domain-containing protein n=1 Tax=Glonium stellatum TaxID=574774 RepID=A0A8E2F9I5_9PEZI|nr:hypothetical protein AOQ84DRAFT_372508 [Glonium stellatum]